MMVETAYVEALKYVFSFIDYSRTHQQNLAPENFELARMARFMSELGQPHLAYPTIHIAGTKGKGSTAALCAAALGAGGYRVGLYTSPHLHSFTERIQINLTSISQQAFVDLVEEIKPHVETIPGLTSYEIQTALAFWHFSRQAVDVAVVEVGMGGRLDSTNVVEPLVSVITSLSLDHTFVLGNTLGEIAGEKGGIIKPGVPVVSAPQKEEALAVLRQMADEHDAPLTVVGEDLWFETLSSSLEGQILSLRTSDGSKDLELSLRLLGEHQVENAATAYTALDSVRHRGLPLTDEAIRAGFAALQWPGRFEVVRQAPPVVFDVAHNRDSARRLRQAMAQYFSGKPVTLVFGALADKDIPGMFAELLPHVAVLILFKPNHPRAASLEKLQELAGGFPAETLLAASPERAWEQAIERAANDGVILVTGSLTTVGELRISYPLNIG